MQFKKTQITRILGCSQATEDKWIDAINAACAKFSIDTKLRLAAFIAQVGHESNRLAAVTENLNYSAAGLQGTWPSRFDSAKAQACARQPEKIANVVYGGRMGNGPEASGDGWKYRGRGLIQCTGKSNYMAFSQACGVDAVSNPDSLTQPTNAALSAAWFWNSKGLNSYADRSDFLSITKRINGGTIGQADREMLYKKAIIVLSDEELPTDDEVAKKADPTPDTTAPVSEEKTPAAQNTSIIEPKAASGDTAKYPWNFVTESRSGHYTEIDDTPGGERINMTHRTGSYWEIDSLGKFTHKSVMDAYKLTKGDSYDYTGGNYTQQVQGQAYRQTSGDMIFKVGGNFFVTASKIQMNTGMMSVSGEINAPAINSPMFSGMGGGSAYGDLLSREALVAYDLRDGGAPMLGGALGFTAGTSEGSTGSADSHLSNSLSKQSPTGTPWVTNGVVPSSGSSSSGSDGSDPDPSLGSDGVISSSSATLSGTNSNDFDVPPTTGGGWKITDLAKVGIGAAAAAAAVVALVKESDPDPAVASAMASAVGNLNSKTYAQQAQTPVFLKHVSFDKPTLFSQSTAFGKPDPALFMNNYHTIVDAATGIGRLYISDGQDWVLVGDGKEAKAYTDQVTGELNDSFTQQLIDEATARVNGIAAEASARQVALTQGLLDEATARQAAVVAEATARQTEDTSLSNRIVTLTAAVDDNAAAIQEETTARADAITAEANARLVLAATVAGNTSAITAEQTARANADSALTTSINQVSAATDSNTAAITAEQTARTSADSALSTRIDAVVATADTNTAAIITEQTARASGDSANAGQITIVQSRINNGNASSFEPYLSWDFNALDGWTTANASTSLANGVLTLTHTAADGQLISPTISVVGGTYDKVRARIKRNAGSGWDGLLYYSTAGHGFNSSYYDSISSPTSGELSDWYIVEWDLTTLVAGGTDWTGNTITSIRLDLGNTSSDSFFIDWISIGKRGVGVQGSAFASVQTLSSTTATDVGNVKAQWGVKTNVNGHVSGIALVSDLIAGNPTSTFTIEADKFKVVKPGTTDGNIAPFSIDTSGASPVINMDATVRIGMGNNLDGVTGNLLANASVSSTASFAVGYNSTGQTTSGLVYNPPGTWAPTGMASVYIMVNNSPANGTVFDLVNDNYGNLYPVVAGQRYEASCYASLHRCNGIMTIGWYDSSGVYISETQGATATIQGASGTLSTFPRATVFGVAPANAVKAKVWIRGVCVGGQANPYVFGSMWYFGTAGANQVNPATWSPGGIGSVPSLSALSANIGLLRTASSGQRTEIDSNGVRVYDSAGTLRVRLGVW
jgi:putative chitinase